MKYLMDFILVTWSHGEMVNNSKSYFLNCDLSVPRCTTLNNFQFLTIVPFHIQHTFANLVNYMVFTIAESSTLRGKCCDWDGWPGTEGGWQCKRGQCIAVAMYTGATVTDCADSVIAASPSPRPTYQIPRRALTFNFCCSTSPPTNCESFINLFFATSDSHLMPDLLDPSWSNCFQANPWSDEMLGTVLWPAMSSWAKKIFWSKNDFQCRTLSFKPQHVLVFHREYVCARSKEMQGWEVSRCGEMSTVVDGTLWQNDGRMCGISRDQPSHRPYLAPQLQSCLSTILFLPREIQCKDSQSSNEMKGKAVLGGKIKGWWQRFELGIWHLP